MNLDRFCLAAVFAAHLFHVRAGEFFVPPKVRITELMYHPPGGDAQEFLELKNLENQQTDVSGWSFSGVSYTFPPLAKLAPGQVIVLSSDSNPGAFEARYPGVTVFGRYGGKLANSGEKIVLNDAAGHVVTAVNYQDGGFWPKAADGDGYSLETIDPNGDAGDPANWKASDAIGGSPGVFKAALASPIIEINELLADNFSAVSHLGGNPDFVELHNPQSTNVDLSTWSLSDHQSDPRRFLFPASTIMQPGSYLVIWMDTLTANGELHSGFSLERSAGALALFDSNTNRVDIVSYGNQATDYSLGRFSTGWALSVPTPGGANQSATLGAPTSLVINEWYADSLSKEPDWIELYNKDTTKPVALKGLYVGIGDVAYQITSQSFVAPGGFAQLNGDSSPDPDHFLIKLPSSGGVILLGDSSGQQIDKIEYGQQSDGQSEGRLPDGSGNFVFFSNNATPGGSNLGDDDGDGLPNYWEVQYHLNPKAASDALADADGDGESNLAEYLSGNNPTNATSVFRLGAILTGKEIHLSFTALPDRHYVIQDRAFAQSGRWTTLLDVPENAALRVITATDLVSIANARIYQITLAQTNIPSILAIAQTIPAAGANLWPQGNDLFVDFNQPVDPTTITTNNFTLIDDLNRAVVGRVRFYNGFTRVSFEPAPPLDGLTLYTATLNSASTATGKSLATTLSWQFTTALAGPIVEDKTIYLGNPLQLPDAHVNVVERPGGYTFEDVYNDTDPKDDYQPQVEVILQASDYGQGVVEPNGLIGQRGQSNRHTGQKSYKISLYNNVPKWDGFATLNLNKHAYDLTRLRNKLSFDFMSELTNFTSLRTSFVDMFVKTNQDETDFGLFTHVENPDADFLKSHGLDPNGNMYKATFFEFLRYEEDIKLTTDPTYDKAAFESHLEIKNGNDHTKIIAMLDDVNNEDIPIDRVIEKHFNRDNYITWLAVNVLIENLDTESQNFFLYSPSSSSAWYFLPWDYDGAWSFYEQPNEIKANPVTPRIREGLANWWGAVLHGRFLMEPHNMNDVVARANQLGTNVFTVDHITAFLNQYTNIVGSHIFQPPDVDELPVATRDEQAEWAGEVERMKTVPEKNRQLLLATVNRPMPFFLGDPRYLDGGTYFNWNPAYQAQGHSIIYDFRVSKTPGFEAANLIFEKLGISDLEIVVPQELPPGTYYFQVIARDVTDPQNNWQYPFESYYDDATGTLYQGVKEFELE